MSFTLACITKYGTVSGKKKKTDTHILKVWGQDLCVIYLRLTVEVIQFVVVLNFVH